MTISSYAWLSVIAGSECWCHINISVATGKDSNRWQNCTKLSFIFLFLFLQSVDLNDVLYFHSKTGLCSYVTRISCKSFSLMLSSPTFKLFTYFLCLQLKVTDYLVKCSVVSRYAVTTVQSSVWNQLPITKEAAFEVDLPSSAFISNFTM